VDSGSSAAERKRIWSWSRFRFVWREVPNFFEEHRYVQYGWSIWRKQADKVPKVGDYFVVPGGMLIHVERVEYDTEAEEWVVITNPLVPSLYGMDNDGFETAMEQAGWTMMPLGY
jgi:hypothetical protein